mmetsp:Transcript_7458/g.27266  ORF Transcript_7458/g.27266 Transcript_7458/m.27266 type:complete len:261 (-) Transcript_7458:15-797(-)|eukprot:16450-Pelagococcus_subviridis.AAC.4
MRPYALATFASSRGLSSFNTLPHCASNKPLSSTDGSSPNRVSAQNIIVSSYGLNPVGTVSRSRPLPPRPPPRRAAVAFAFAAAPEPANLQNFVAAVSSAPLSATGCFLSNTANAHRMFATPCGSSSLAFLNSTRSSASQNFAPGSLPVRPSAHVSDDAAHPPSSGSSANARVSSARYHRASSSVPRSASSTCLPRRLYAVATLTTLNDAARSFASTTTRRSSIVRARDSASLTALAASDARLRPLLPLSRRRFRGGTRWR